MKRVLLIALALALTFAVSARSGTRIVLAGHQPAKKTYKACLITSGPVLYDKSFAEGTWNGLQQAAKDFGVQAKYYLSQSSADYVPNIETAISQKCSLVDAISFSLADAVKTEATKHPNSRFAIVDYSYTPPSSLPNVRQIVFATDQAAFQAGYLSAGMTKTGKLGTFGGVKIPPVTVFMDGFVEGANYYNHIHHTHVTVQGWNARTQTGLFTGDFTDEAKGQRTSNSLLGAGADIILPVAGSVGLGTIAAVKAAHKGSVVWVDTDGCKTDAKDCPYFLTTVEKHMTPAAYNTVKAQIKGKFKGGLYTGTLRNNGVGIAPYHQWASKVPAKLQQEVAALKSQIISKKIKIAQWK